MKLLSTLFTGLLFLSVASLSAQEDVAAVEAKLRESLRGAMLQLRNIEAERARLEAELGVLTTQSERQIKDLNAKLEESLKSAAEEKTLADKQIAEQEKKLEA